VTTGTPPTVLSFACKPKVSIVGRERITCSVDYTDEDEEDVGGVMWLCRQLLARLCKARDIRNGVHNGGFSGKSRPGHRWRGDGANLSDETLCRASFLDVVAGAQDIHTALVEWGDDSDPSLCNIANGSENSTSLSITDAFGLKGEAVASADVTECAIANAKCGGQGWEGPSCCPALIMCALA
jgi:hypothetical protein